MSREIASTRLRQAASVALALLACLGAGARAARGQASLSDRLTDCGDAIACEDGGCVGSGAGYCGNLVTPAGGCASGMEMFWFRGDYMAWDREGFDLPPLATAAATVNSLTSEVIAGDLEVSNDWRSGFRLEMGVWLNAMTGWALAADFSNAGRDAYSFSTTVDDPRVIARPFFDTQLDLNGRQFVNAPGELKGALSISAFDDFQGAGAWMQRCIYSDGNGCTGVGTTRLSLIGGYRYYHHDSLVYVDETRLPQPGNTIPDQTPHLLTHAYDKFAARNEFHGAEIGLQGRVQNCRWWVDGLAAIALGSTRRVVFVEGWTENFPLDSMDRFLVNSSGNIISSKSQGDLLVAAKTNFGRYTDFETQVVPRFRLGGGWQATERLSIHAGYNLVIWNIVHAADHLPPVNAANGLPEVDPRNLPDILPNGGAEPVFRKVIDGTMFAHGLDFGLELWF